MYTHTHTHTYISIYACLCMYMCVSICVYGFMYTKSPPMKYLANSAVMY